MAYSVLYSNANEAVAIGIDNRGEVLCAVTCTISAPICNALIFVLVSAFEQELTYPNKYRQTGRTLRRIYVQEQAVLITLNGPLEKRCVCTALGQRLLVLQSRTRISSVRGVTSLWAT